MRERNNCLEKIRADMKVKLREERVSNRARYLATLKNLILQAMIKLIEPSLQICCRADDRSEVQGMLKGLESEYHQFMKDKTGRDEYKCTLSVMDGRAITDEQDDGCGGIVMYTADQRIVCPNMLSSRLQLAFEECLPQIRSTLFPNSKKV